VKFSHGLLRLFRGKSAFVYPIPPAPPTAVLAPWFISRGNVRVFEHGWDAEAALFQPMAIAATWPQMESLFGTRIASLTHALIALARPADPLLTGFQRQQLWDAFRVPIFEQIIGNNGALLAAECEAHAGLHVESPTGEYSIEAAPCGCGRKTPRIVPAPQAEKVHAAAASMR
jgi:hypothetical protein